VGYVEIADDLSTNIPSVAVVSFLLFASINSKFQSSEENNAKLGMEER
jgi:hypothetical protein